jgi:hypothetical protein
VTEGHVQLQKGSGNPVSRRNLAELVVLVGLTGADIVKGGVLMLSGKSYPGGLVWGRPQSAGGGLSDPIAPGSRSRERFP